jgi:hypothetical protein
VNERYREDGCLSCETPEARRNECPRSTRICGHHCNCSWTQDICHFCGAEVNEDGLFVLPRLTPQDLIFNNPNDYDRDIFGRRTT